MEQARKLIAKVTKVPKDKWDLSETDTKKYAAVHALVMSYLDGERGSDIQEGIEKVCFAMCTCPTRTQWRNVLQSLHK